MEIDVLNLAHKVKGKAEISKSIIVDRTYDESVHLAISAYRASLRQGTSKVKDRSEVKATTKKPWKQKGTGRARHGSSASPIWVGGGITFGPNGQKNYTKKQNKKSHKKAMQTLFTEKLKEKEVKVYEVFQLDRPQTKAIVKFLDDAGLSGKKVLIVTEELEVNLGLSTNNLKKVNYQLASKVGVYDLINADVVVFNKAALEVFQERWS